MALIRLVITVAPHKLNKISATQKSVIGIDVLTLSHPVFYSASAVKHGFITLGYNIRH